MLCPIALMQQKPDLALHIEHKQLKSSLLLQNEKFASQPMTSAIISTVGSIVGLTIQWGIGSASRIHSLLGAVLGLASIAIGVECAAAQFIQVVSIAKRCHINCSKIRSAEREKILKTFQDLDYELQAFVASLDSRQRDIILSILGEDEGLEGEPICIGEDLKLAFCLTQKQSKLLEIFASVCKLESKLESKKMKGLETFCKLSHAAKKNQLQNLKTILQLTPVQQGLYDAVTRTLNQTDEKIIQLTIRHYLSGARAANIACQTQMFILAESVALFAIPFLAILEVLHPDRWIGTSQLVSAVWTSLQELYPDRWIGTTLLVSAAWTSLQVVIFLLGAFVVGHILYQHTISPEQEEQRHLQDLMLQLDAL